MIHWLRFQAPKSGAGVPSLVRELDPTCCHKQSLRDTATECLSSRDRGPQLEKPLSSKEDPTQPNQIHKK